MRYFSFVVLLFVDLNIVLVPINDELTVFPFEVFYYLLQSIELCI